MTEKHGRWATTVTPVVLMGKAEWAGSGIQRESRRRKAVAVGRGVHPAPQRPAERDLGD